MAEGMARRVLVIASIILSAAGASWAQETPAKLPRTGEFSLVYTFVNPEPWAPIPRGAEASGAITHTAVINTNIAWLMNTAGSGFGHAMTGRCGSFQRAEGSSTMENRGNCVYTDADGDMLFEEFWRNPGDRGNTGRWVGGTGKYAGVSSNDFEIKGIPGFGGRTEGQPVGTNASAGLTELYGLNAGLKNGTYTLP